MMFSRLTGSKSSLSSGVLLIFILAIALAPQSSRAQDTAIFVSIRDTFAYPGQEIHLPVMITNLRDSIDGYQIQYQADRPNMIFFSDTVAIESLIVCANPPSCTVMDTIIDTVSRTPVDVQGTLTSTWEWVSGRNLGMPTFVRVSAIADMTGDNKPHGIPPSTMDATLVSLVAFVYCPPDQFGGGVVQLFPTYLNFDFSDPWGNLIVPIAKRDGTIRILDPVPGDLDYTGSADVMDIIQMIGCAFEDKCPACTAIQIDFNCDQQPDVMDVIALIEYVFQGGSLPGC
jgi:hypothetical protein